jgi:hypothetical protein
MDIPDLKSLQSALETMAKGAAQPEKSEPGPGDVGPTTETKDPNGLVTLKMTPDEVSEWWQRVERSRQRIRAREEKWDLLLKEYLPTVSPSGEAETVKVMKHFRNVHSKIGALFYRTPDLVLTPDEPSMLQVSMPNPMSQFLPPGMPPLPPLTMEDIVSVKQEVLNKKMGRDGIKGNRLIDELLFDVLAWSGIGCAKLGYRCITKTYNQPVMQPDPTFVPPPATSILGLGAPSPQPPMVPKLDPVTQQPMTTPVPVVIFEDWYARRFSPKKLLVNDDLRSTRFDEDATMMGMEFFMSPKRAMKEFHLTAEEVSKAADDDRIFAYKEDEEKGTKVGLVHGVELWVKASVFTDEVHPQAINQLVLLEGITDKPVVWRPSPDQEFDETGKLTENSLIGFPIKVLTIRDVADSCFPPSDSAFTNSEIKQLTTWRRQSVLIRNAAIGKYFYDTGLIDDDDLEKLQKGDVGEYIGVEPGALKGGKDTVVTTTAQIHQTADDYKGAELLKQDIDETLGISSIQAGTPEETVRTATEIANVQAAVAARNEKEKLRVVDFWIDIVRAIDQLLMRYATENQYVQLTGPDGAKRMQAWNGAMISGRYLYEISPDSQSSPDNAGDFKLDLQFYNQAAPDPLFNRGYMLRRLARRRGLDPAKVVLNPVDMMGQPPHGGPSQQGATVSQHAASNSGNRPNEPGAPNQRQEQVK